MKPIYLKMTAFGPYLEPVELNFEEELKQDIFVVTGPTGAGKTTIYDAICYALYGKTSGKKRTVSELRSHFASTDSPLTNTNLFKEVWGSGVLVKQKHTAAWYFDKHLIGRLKDDGVDTLYKIYDIGKDGYGYRYIKSPSKLNNKRGKIYQGMPLDKSESIKNSGVAKNINK